ncbi:spore germination protein [Bacillus sp. EAC]|uniref:spore germination protein n=1 Tax=Bacillus sp. EAC TaxID=1978338 RepID=UPI000B447BFD|nr:spore germination protein [Bacillus sp. EAC]
MPTFLGAIVIQNNEGSINTGDLNNISPKTATKSYFGSGSGNTGFIPTTVSGASATNTLDADLADQNDVATL